MNNKIVFIKITLWWGIIADLFETIRMIYPQLFIYTTGANVKIDNSFRFALLYAAPVMLGWTLLLFWTTIKPIERRGVLICLIPVILFYYIVEIIGINAGVLSCVKTIPTFILQAILLSLTIVSYFFTKKIAKKKKS